MSSYRKRTQSKPTTAAGLRAQASASGNSIFRSRPRSIAGEGSYSSLLGGPSSYLSKSSPSSYKKRPYSSSAGNLSGGSYPYTTYGGTSSGYGALTLPSGPAYGYLSRDGSVHRGGSFGSRSSSLQSLAGSEGYASGHDRSGRSSRLGSVSSLANESAASPSSRGKSAAATTENGELDYKKLYEESQAENERLREKLRKSDELAREAQAQLERAQSKSALTEAEKRERRAMERKLSEMEEELKMMETLKCENQRLKDENGALIRVISKLSK